MEAIRHALGARDWGLAARMLCDHWPGLVLDGRGPTVHGLLAAFPAGVTTADAELAALMAGDELVRGSLSEAERHLALADQGLASVDEGQSPRLQVIIAVVRMRLARQRGDLPGVVEEAHRLLAPGGTVGSARLEVAEDLRALALVNLGIAELWAARFEEAGRHLEDGVALARRIGRPYLEFSGLAHQAVTDLVRSFARAAEHAREAIELAGRHGWTDTPAVGIAYQVLGGALVAHVRRCPSSSSPRRACSSGMPGTAPATPR